MSLSVNPAPRYLPRRPPPPPPRLLSSPQRPPRPKSRVMLSEGWSLAPPERNSGVRSVRSGMMTGLDSDRDEFDWKRSKSRDRDSFGTVIAAEGSLGVLSRNDWIRSRSVLRGSTTAPPVAPADSAAPRRLFMNSPIREPSDREAAFGADSGVFCSRND